MSPTRTALALAALAPTAALLCAAGGCGGGASADPADAAGAADADAGDPQVVLSTTLGDLVVEVYPGLMPVTSANFLAYVDSGFYDGTLIHRVIDDWVIQGGGYTSGLTPVEPGDPIPLETSDEVSHVHGALSMARTSDPDSATSQWFLCDWPAQGVPPQPAALDGNYAAFGVLIEGFDVLADITQVATASQGALDDVPVVDIVVTAAYRR